MASTTSETPTASMKGTKAFHDDATPDGDSHKEATRDGVYRIKDQEVVCTSKASVSGRCPIKEEYLIPEHLLKEMEDRRVSLLGGDTKSASNDKTPRRLGMNKMRKKSELGYSHTSQQDGPSHKGRNLFQTNESNILSVDLKNDLRKKRYPFRTYSVRPKGQKRMADGTEVKSQNADETQTSASSSETVNNSTAVGQVSSAGGSDKVNANDREKKPVDFRERVYVAPLTTLGNLPFRRVMKKLGADITCGEMAMFKGILQGNPAEWALLRRHPCEDVFGVQIAGSHADTMGRTAEVIENECNVDFVDINMGCPLDMVCNKGMGASLMDRQARLQEICETMSDILSCPLTLKFRTGLDRNKPLAQKLLRKVRGWNVVSACALHGRSRAARYTKRADWDYISSVVDAANEHMEINGEVIPPMPLIGNGDVLNWEDWYANQQYAGTTTNMLARGALIKPWLPTEIKEQKTWDISSKERFEILKDFVKFGLDHWGSDEKGVSKTRRFLLEWLSFLCRYVPVGLMERLPQRLNDRPPSFVGRDDLETLLSSRRAEDWVKISEMLLGPVPDDFKFVPKHQANSYASSTGDTTLAVSPSTMDKDGLHLITRINGSTLGFACVQDRIDALMDEMSCPLV
eukprot:gb/GECG01010793.1/.p1 GENE.gb/GECG01010793.1/~~gb/GECG01010793.1/.p1  ORF type:complete len:631 (+),score=72.13 gb/GECG01010793.1/:1-1893(+)